MRQLCLSIEPSTLCCLSQLLLSVTRLKRWRVQTLGLVAGLLGGGAEMLGHPRLSPDSCSLARLLRRYNRDAEQRKEDTTTYPRNVWHHLTIPT